MTEALERYESSEGLLFDIRPDTSDIKAIREVIEKQSYGRYKFVPSPGEFWIDLGANIGAFSIWAAKQDESIRIHAYEADPVMCELLLHNAQLNGVADQIDVFHSAVVADNRRSVVLHTNSARGNVWRNSIERVWRGGEDITVPAFPIKKVLQAVPNSSYLKMDIEGTEMPILEWMCDPEQDRLVARKLKGMVFEWSFDVDPNLARFRAVIDSLKIKYEVVKNDRINKEDELTDWPAEWFPPCRLIWAWTD